MSSAFSALCTAMDAAGIEVGVVLTEDEEHVIRLVDFHGCRSLDVAVTRRFDAAVIVAVCSLALCPESPPARVWPELVALAEALVVPPDAGVSNCDRPEQLS